MSAPLLKIREELANQIRAHGVETYPYECCGAILGRDGASEREVLALLPLANRMLAETYVRVEGVFGLIGAGGIDSGASALAKIRAGASLIQIYSGLVFRGLGLVAEIKAALVAALDRDGESSLADYIGADAAAVTAEPWPQ